MFSERALCDIYMLQNDAQGVKQGDVLLTLLYAVWPELKEFRFHAYSLSPGEKEDSYLIFPNNNIYTPFTALMNQDVDSIKKRNREYCRSYNHGEYTPEKCEERLEGEVGKHFFDVIRILPSYVERQPIDWSKANV